MKIEVINIFTIVLSTLNLILFIFQFIRESKVSKRNFTVKAIDELRRDVIYKLDDINDDDIKELVDSYGKNNQSKEIKCLKKHH